MTRLSAALMALSFVCACSGDPSNSGNGDGGNTDGVITSDGGTAGGDPSLGGLNVHESSGKSCQVVIAGEVAGETDANITGLEPGTVDFQLGVPDKSTLAGAPFHIENEEYYTGAGSGTVVAGKVTPASATLNVAAQYDCGYTDCGYPYGGGECSGSAHDDDPQWIYVDETGTLHGSQNDQFGSLSGVTVSLQNGELVASSDDGDTITGLSFDSETLSFGYTVTNDDLEFVINVACNPK